MKAIDYSNTIYKYDHAFKVFQEWTPAEKLNSLTDEQLLTLSCIDDYEYFSYYVMDGKTIYICDGPDGGNIISASTLEFYIDETIKYIKENTEE